MKYSLFFIFFIYVGCASEQAQTSRELEPLTNKSSCQEGAIRRGFMAPTTQGDFPCPVGVQTCKSGIWQGPIIYESCENNTKSCDGSPHGSVIKGYLQPTSTKDFPCSPATNTCVNGLWMGPEIFETCTEL